ncbi:hypothetical protein WN944_012276 [Citrus x changshan-huyou]|uniref:Uncharacterized protein n=1 Tax=Citrus x changshan-huyou TaxID=2935761 RepID=A0AAP0QYM2_9ROSI
MLVGENLCSVIACLPKFQNACFDIAKTSILKFGDTTCRTGDNSLSPQISKCLFRYCKNKHSEIWGDKNCRTGDNSLSPQISECSFLQYRNKHSEIWGDKLLSPVRQDVSPNFRMLVFAISNQAFCNLGRQDVVSRATFYLPKIQNFCLEVK